MGLGKTYSTKYLADSNNNTGSANQVLVSTATGIDWVDGSGAGIIGGPYLPLAGGTITGDLNITNSKIQITAGAPEILLSVPSGGLDSRLYNDGGGNFFIGHGTNGATPTVRLAVTSTGNVGIGTTSPARILHIEDSSVAAIQLENTSEADSFIDFMNPSRTFRVGYDDSTDLFKVAVTNFNSNALVVNPSGNVGIGTTSPANLLQVNSPETTSASDAYINVFSGHQASGGSDTTGEAGVLFRHYTGTQYFRAGGVVSGREGNYSVTSLADSYLRFETAANNGNAEHMRITSAGNVGIGTTSPNAKLDVVASYVNATPNPESSAVFRRNGNNYLTILTGSTNQGGILFGNAADTNDGGISYTHSTQSMAFSTADTQRMFITSAGNVGIGTTNPGAKLHVYTQTGNTTMAVGRGAGQSSIKASADADGGYLALDSVSNAVIINHYSSDDVWLVTGGGNVGIGTTGPTQKLHVVGNAIVTGFINAGTGTDNAQIGPGYLLFYNAGSSPKYIKLSDDASTIDAIGFSKSGAVSTTWFPTGNVGIGTSSPGAKLHVLAASSNSQLILERTGTATGKYNIHTNTNNLYINNVASSTYPLTILNSGNVGIGTTTPNYALDIEKDTGSLLNLYRPNSSTAAASFIDFSFNTANATEAVYARIRSDVEVNTNSAQGGDLSFHTANSGTVGEVMRLTQEGNVGIGTTNPDAKLDVLTTTGPQIRLSRNSTQYSTLYSDSAGGLIISSYSSGASNYQVFSINSSEKLRIINNGNVGINTTNPSYKLDVNGTANISGAATMAGPVKMVGLSQYADDVAAGNAGLQTGDLYYSLSGGDRVIKMKI
jgi:hypothetical protein